MDLRIYIAPAMAALALVISGSTVEAAPAKTVTPGTTTIDLAGEMTTAGLTGGMSDPVPLFSGASGPVIFVMGTPGLDTGANDLAPSVISHPKPAVNTRRAR